MKVVLASASPRRRELLEQIGLAFEVKESNVRERITSTVPAGIVCELSTQKAEAVLQTMDGESDKVLVIGADTLVACDNKILGKPRDKEHARQMLRFLSGRAHQVYTGVCMLYKTPTGLKTRTFYEVTQVTFSKMSEGEIDAYVATKEPLDKAGAYGIQGVCARYIQGIEGDYNNVVGLPLGRVYQEIKEIL